jgi:two-component system sensor histidine kinase YesM
MKYQKQPTKSLRARINLSFLLIVAIAVVSFLIISINRSSEAIKESSVKNTLQLVQLVNENIESYMENMENISQIVINSSDAKNYLTIETNKNAYAVKVEEQFEILKETRDDIYNIGIVGKNGTYLINNHSTEINPYADVKSLVWYQEALKGKKAISSSHVQNIVIDKYSWVVTMSKAIRSPFTNEVTGVFFIDLNYRSISNLCEEIDLGSQGYIFIVDKEGDIVYHPKQQLIYSGFWEEEIDEIMSSQHTDFSNKDGSRMYTISKSEVTGWTVVGVSYFDEMLSSTNELINVYYFIAVLLIGVAMVLAVLLTNKITQPIRKLQESMRSVQDGNFEVNVGEVVGQDEIGSLIYSFQIMVQKIKQLIEHNTNVQEEKRKNELNTLQAQINPHFLYNTLDSIIWMAEGHDTKNVILMTSSLAKLLRKSISNKRELVTVAEEIEYTRSYLVIQKMRYKDKLKYSINVEDSVQGVEMVKLIVQPIVENAIYHGIKYKEGMGNIIIEASLMENDILIQVMDDGQGMNEEQLAHILDEKETDMRKNSVGVWNVHRRIQLYYGIEYGISYVSSIGMGTIASIRLPNVRRGHYDKENIS